MERAGTPLAGPVLRVAGAAGLLLLTAAVVLTVGGAGVFGTLGSIFGADDASAGEGAAVADARDSRRYAAIVAVPPPARAPAGSRRAPGDGRGTSPGAPAPQPRGPGAPAPSPPGAPSPSPGVPSVPAPPAQPAPSPVVDTIERAVDQVAEQAPPEAKPIIEPVQQLVDQVAEQCAQVPVCP